MIGIYQKWREESLLRHKKQDFVPASKAEFVKTMRHYQARIRYEGEVMVVFNDHQVVGKHQRGFYFLDYRCNHALLG